MRVLSNQETNEELVMKGKLVKLKSWKHCFLTFWISGVLDNQKNVNDVLKSLPVFR